VKGLTVHALVFALAAGLAVSAWSRDENAVESGTSEKVEVWSGNVDSISRLDFQSPKLTLVLESKQDGTGRYFVAAVDKEVPKPRPAPDAGAPEPAKRTTTRFIAVKNANELAQKLAPLLAVRRIGAFEPGRAEEFGLDKPEGTLKLKVGGAEQSLVIGSSTPGAQERYARHLGSNGVYAIEAELAQSLLAADSHLLEREFHGFQETDVTRIRITRAGKSREFSPLPGKKGSFADVATPNQADQTATNWLGKVSQLKVSEYVEKPAAGLTPESLVARIEYFGAAKSLGFLELHAVPGEKGSDYLARTEYTRWHVKVPSSLGEQVDQDLASLLR
jgi:hypothetical protein